MKSAYQRILSSMLLCLWLSPRLNKLLGNVIISQGGVVPHIEGALLPSKTSVSNVLRRIRMAWSDLDCHLSERRCGKPGNVITVASWFTYLCLPRVICLYCMCHLVLSLNIMLPRYGIPEFISITAFVIWRLPNHVFAHEYLKPAATDQCGTCSRPCLPSRT